MSVSISNKMDNMSKFLVQTTYLFILANDNLIGIEPSISQKIGYLEVFRQSYLSR